MSFFKQFPKTDIAIGTTIETVVDIFRHVDVNDVLADEISNYQYYIIQDGERPDNLSQKLYGTPDYYWTFFILNESLKNGIDDWPKSSFTIENEFANEYDDIAALTFMPAEGQKFVESTEEISDAKFAGFNINSFNGLDLSYENLRVQRNFEEARIVKWDSTNGLLYLADFTNRENFLADPRDEAVSRRLDNIYIDGRGLYAGAAPISWGSNFITKAEKAARRAELNFSFAGWPRLGVKPGEISPIEGIENYGSDGRLVGGRLIQQFYDEDGTLQGTDNTRFIDEDFRRRTMTKSKYEWIIHLFEWLDTTIHRGNYRDANIRGLTSTEQIIEGASLQTPYYEWNKRRITQASVEAGGSKIHPDREAALDIFYDYFFPRWYDGEVKFSNFKPFRLQGGDGPEHTWNSLRNAPHHYYVGNDASNRENWINAYEVLVNNYKRTDTIYNANATDGYEEVELTSEPNKYQTNYQWEQSQIFEKSRIKVIKPELIRQFAAAFREKLNTGLTRTQGVNTIPRIGPSGGAVSQTATPGVNAPASNAPTGGGGLSSGGGSGGY